MGDHACRYRHDDGALFPLLGRVVRPLHHDHMASKVPRSKGFVDPQGVGSIREYATSEIMLLVLDRLSQQTPAQRKSLSVRLTLVDHYPHYEHERPNDRRILGISDLWGPVMVSFDPGAVEPHLDIPIARGQRRWRR